MSAAVATTCTRLELWSALQCAGGRRLGMWTRVLAAGVTLTLGLDSRLTVQVPLDEDTTTALARWQVVRVWESDAAWDEWIVTDVERSDTVGTATLQCAWPTVLLGRSGLVDERTPDGRVRYELDRVGLAPSLLLDTLVIAPCAAQGLSWVRRGTVTPADPVDLTLAWVTPLQVLTQLAGLTGAELQLRRVGVSHYAVDLVTAIGAEAPVLDVRRARNLLDLGQSETLSEHATVLVPKGATIDGEAGTLAENVWRVASIAGSVVTLANPNGADGPLAWDGQLDGLALETAPGVRVPIVSSYAVTQAVNCASAPVVSVGAEVRIVETDGADVTTLPCPPAVEDYGRVIGTLERVDVPAHRNLIPNSIGRVWTGAPTTPPDGWSVVGSVTCAQLTSGPRITRGPRALRLTMTTASTGVRTPSIALAPTAERPWLSGYVTCFVEVGQVRVELVATTATGEKVYPLGGNLATSSEIGTQIDLGLAGIDAHAAGITSAYLRVVQHGTAATTVVVQSAQLTRSVAQLPFVEGAGANTLWTAANAALTTRAIPRLRSTVALVDLARLDPVQFGDAARITLGGVCRVVQPLRAIDGTARVVVVVRNLLRAGDAQLTLSDKPEDLTGSLARTTTRPRPLPSSPPIVLSGDVTVSTAFDAAGALTILVNGPDGSDSLRAAVSTSSMPTASAVDAATGTLRADGVDVVALTAPGPYAVGDVLFIAARAYRGGVGSRVVQVTDARDAADAAQGPSLSVRLAYATDRVTVRYAAIGVVTIRVSDGAEVAAPASPFDLMRPAHGSVEAHATLFCTRNGLVASEPILLPPIGVDTVTPDLEVIPGQPTSDTAVFSVFASDPSGRGGTITRTMRLTGCTARGFTGPGPHTLTDGATVVIELPFARANGAVTFAAELAGGGRAEQTRTIPAQDLSGRGVEVFSNPDFEITLPFGGDIYDNFNTGLVSFAFGAEVGQNASGRVVTITKAAGPAASPGFGGVGFATTRTTAASEVHVADRYREGRLYLVTARAQLPVGTTISWHSDQIGTGAAAEPISSVAGTGAWETYAWRVQIGVGGVFSTTNFFALNAPGDQSVARTWKLARVSMRDLTAAPRVPAVTCRYTVTASDGDTITVQVTADPAVAASRVVLAACSAVILSGAPVGTPVVSGSSWTFERRGFRLGNADAVFQASTPGYDTDDATLTITERGRDTVTLAVKLIPGAVTATTQTVSIVATDPFPQGANTILAAITSPDVSVSPVGPIALTSGTPSAIVITRPPQGALPTRVVVEVAAANRVATSDAVDVQPQDTLVPGRIVPRTATQAGADYVLHFEAFDSLATELTDVGVLSVTMQTTPETGAPTSSSVTVVRDTVNGWYTAQLVRPIGVAVEARIRLTVSGTAVTEIVVPVPTYTATPRITARQLTVGTTSPYNVALTWTAVNAPAGATYSVTYQVGTAAGQTLDNISSGVVLSSGVASPAPGSIRGTLSMVSSSGAVLSSVTMPLNILS